MYKTTRVRRDVGTAFEYETCISCIAIFSEMAKTIIYLYFDREARFKSIDLKLQCELLLPCTD